MSIAITLLVGVLVVPVLWAFTHALIELWTIAWEILIDDWRSLWRLVRRTR